MYDTLFRYPAIVARHQGGRFAAARELFLNRCASQGMAHATLQRYAQELLVVAERIDITVGDAIDSAVIEAAADHWAPCWRPMVSAALEYPVYVCKM